MLTQTIRRKFLEYFKKQGHAVVASSSVVPHDDPTLLFNNAGMNQFKDLFLGKSLRDYKRATTSQKCIRAGGKHNDLENVGHTSRHTTFFEMLGNFSFGDYFKKDAIRFAWEVSTLVFELDSEKIWVTVFEKDDEAAKLWEAHISTARIVRFGEKENFWAMGDTGPCGPCSELLYDRGPQYGTATTPLEDTDGERFLEFWNLVFMQYNRQPSGELLPLPKPSIDTGAGLERILSLKMHVPTVFQTDVFRSLIDQVEQISGVQYDPKNRTLAPAFNVIADHIRTLSFAIADGAQPSNVDRGYVLRKILRRAVRYGRSLGMEEPFLAKVLPRLVEIMGTDYPELKKAEKRIAEILTNEEESFIQTLRRGGNLLNTIISRAQQHQHRITGDESFKLKDTYGFPIDETLLLAKDAGLTVDIERYKTLENEARERSRAAHKSVQQIASQMLYEDLLKHSGATTMLCYTQKEAGTPANATITAIVVNGEFVQKMTEGEEGMVILNQTPFYPEMGGQVGDMGVLTNGTNAFDVYDCNAPFTGIITHLGKLTHGELNVGAPITATIDTHRRQRIANNHTATHLLHWALHEVLGEHVRQAGSVVEPERLRFDFSHHKGLTPQEIKRVEDLVNTKVRENQFVSAYELKYEDVQKRKDIKQFFGEKYGNTVRVIDIDYCKELCGGTHTKQVGTIGLFRIAKEGSVSAGMRRIEAVTGIEAEEMARASDQIIQSLQELLKAQRPDIGEKITKLVEENKQLEQELKKAKKAGMGDVLTSLLTNVLQIKGIAVLTTKVAADAEELQALADGLMEKMKSGVLVLAAIADEKKCQVLVRVSPDVVVKGIKANEIIKAIAPLIEGGGGGKADSAQAGGKAPQRLEEAFTKVQQHVASI